MQQAFNFLSELFGRLSSAIADSQNEVSQVMLLLGSTLVSPREVYLVVLPPSHTDDGSVAEVATVRKCMTRVFREMITNFSLWDGGSTGVTNATVLLKMARRDCVAEGLTPLYDEFDVPKRSSKLVRFYLSEDKVNSSEDEQGVLSDLSSQLKGMSIGELGETESQTMWVKVKPTVKGLKVKSI